MPDTQGTLHASGHVGRSENQAAFEAEYGKPLPTDYDGFIDWITVQDYEDLWAFFTAPTRIYTGWLRGTAKSMTSSPCAYPFVYATGGDIWDETTGDVVGVLNRRTSAAQLEYFVSLQKYQPPESARPASASPR
ncbi:MAG: hypothetical protein R2838_10765 [Caldilineaceae bacterium]